MSDQLKKAIRPLVDKREGACLNGPCRMPRRCWRYVNCYLYAATSKVQG